MSRESTNRAIDSYLLPAMPGSPSDIVVDRAEGCHLWDVNGEEYLDAMAGISVTNTGHCHPRVVEAVQDQAERVLHTSFFLRTEASARLLERLAERTPGDLHYSFLVNSGAEAVEGLFKLAKRATGRTEIVSLRGSFHGRSSAALAATGQAERSSGMAPYAPGFYKAPSPNYYRYGDRFDDAEAFGIWAAEQVRETIKFDSNDDVAGVLVEPIQGEGGTVVPPDSYLPRLREVCDEEDVLLLVDEVQTGMGRTGELFAVEHWDVEPDAMALAKGLGSGMPIGAFVASKSVGEAMHRGDHFSTFGGNPVSSAAAAATFDVIQNEGLVANAAAVGAHALDRLEELEADHPFIGDVRGKGLLIGVELVTDPDDRTPATDAAKAVYRSMVDQHVAVTVPNGPDRNVLRLAPPLTITRDQMDEILDAMETAFHEVGPISA